MKIIFLIFTLAVLILTLPRQAPVIGIYTQSDSGDEPKSEISADWSLNEDAGSHSYIAASYVKFLQMSGAQVIPLFAYSSQSYFDNILPKINGVLFPGNKLFI